MPLTSNPTLPHDNKKPDKAEFSPLQKCILADTKKKWLAQIDLVDPKFTGNDAKSKELKEWRNDEAHRLLKSDSAFATDPKKPEEYIMLKKRVVKWLDNQKQQHINRTLKNKVKSHRSFNGQEITPHVLSKLADSLISFKKGSTTGKTAFENHIKAEITELADIKAKKEEIDFIASYQKVLTQKWGEADQEFWAKKAREQEYDIDDNQKQLVLILYESLHAIASGGTLGDVEFAFFYGVRDTKGIRNSGVVQVSSKIDDPSEEFKGYIGEAKYESFKEGWGKWCDNVIPTKHKLELDDVDNSDSLLIKRNKDNIPIFPSIQVRNFRVVEVVEVLDQYLGELWHAARSDEEIILPPWIDIANRPSAFFDTSLHLLPVPLRDPQQLTAGQAMDLAEHFASASSITSEQPFQFYSKEKIQNSQNDQTLTFASAATSPGSAEQMMDHSFDDVFYSPVIPSKGYSNTTPGLSDPPVTVTVTPTFSSPPTTIATTPDEESPTLSKGLSPADPSSTSPLSQFSTSGTIEEQSPSAWQSQSLTTTVSPNTPELLPELAISSNKDKPVNAAPALQVEHHLQPVDLDTISPDIRTKKGKRNAVPRHGRKDTNLEKLLADAAAEVVTGTSTGRALRKRKAPLNETDIEAASGALGSSVSKNETRLGLKSADKPRPEDAQVSSNKPAKRPRLTAEERKWRNHAVKLQDGRIVSIQDAPREIQIARGYRVNDATD